VVGVDDLVHAPPALGSDDGHAFGLDRVAHRARNSGGDRLVLRELPRNDRDQARDVRDHAGAVPRVDLPAAEQGILHAAGALRARALLVRGPR
jgi:hypothetical protein